MHLQSCVAVMQEGFALYVLLGLCGFLWPPHPWLNRVQGQMLVQVVTLLYWHDVLVVVQHRHPQ